MTSRKDQPLFKDFDDFLRFTTEMIVAQVAMKAGSVACAGVIVLVSLLFP